MKNIFIIIVTYNGKKWIQKCLKTTKPIPVIVVDNNSQDGTVELIKSKFPEVVLLEQNGNLGFGQANNIGITYALKQSADYVFLLNQDAYLELGSLKSLIDVQKRNSHYGILSPLHHNGKGDRLDENFSNYMCFNANPNFYSDFVLNKKKKEIYEVPFVNAAGWLISRSCLETVGGFDPIFFHYGEDDNYCQRLKFHGFKIGVVPQVHLKHDRENRKIKPATFENNEYFKKYERKAKLKYADINSEDFQEVEKLIKKRQKSAIKSFIKLRFKAGKFYRREAQLLKRIYPEILKSRELNKTKGSTYLNL